jgi:hypothetical protein
MTMDMRSPADYGMSPTPNGEYFRYTSSGSYYQDMLSMPGSVDPSSPGEFNLSQFSTAQTTPCLTAGSDVENGWAHTPPLSHTPDIILDAGHQDSDFGGPNAYGLYQGRFTHHRN